MCSKEELLKEYETEREAVIAKGREEFLLLEKKVSHTLDQLRKEFLSKLDTYIPQAPKIVDLKEEASDKVKGEPEPTVRVSVKRGSKSAWNMQSGIK